MIICIQKIPWKWIFESKEGSIIPANTHPGETTSGSASDMTEYLA